MSSRVRIKKQRGKNPAFSREDSSFPKAMVGNGDFRFWPSPRVLLVESTHHAAMGHFNFSKSCFQEVNQGFMCGFPPIMKNGPREFAFQCIQFNGFHWNSLNFRRIVFEREDSYHAGVVNFMKVRTVIERISPGNVQKPIRILCDPDGCKNRGGQQNGNQ